MSACSDIPNPEKETALEELKQVDRDFSKMAETDGVGKAFEFYAAENAVMLREKSLPVEGKTSIGELMSGVPDEVSFTWEPYNADISMSGDLGYTLGKWTYSIPDSTGALQTATGRYVSIWKKQEDGSWKYVLDAGSNDPPAEKNEEDQL